MINQNIEFPFVSAMIVARNESAFIKTCLNSLLRQNYPKDKYEILFIDGESEDNSVEIVQALLLNNKDLIDNKPLKIRCLNNPNKFLASGWNIGIKEAKGDFVVRIDAHSYVDENFLTKCVETMYRVKDAVCVGGCMISDAINEQGKAISLVLSSPFGVGNSKFRYSKKAGYVDTVAFGLYRKSIFEQVGFFDEKLKRNQDIDLHSRIKSTGGKFYLDPSIIVTYYSRSTVKSMIKQGYQNGKWNLILLKKNFRALSMRHIIPLFFIFFILGSTLLGFLHNYFWYLLFLVFLLHFILGIIFSIKRTFNLRYLIKMPFLFLALHSSYGIGSLMGIFKNE